MREEILYTGSRTGTTIVFFDTFRQPNIAQEIYPAYMRFDNLGQPYQITTFDGVQQWVRNLSNNNLLDVNLLNYTTVSGSVNSVTVERVLSNAQRRAYRQGFVGEMIGQFSGLSESYVFFREQLVDDLFVTIGLERTEKILNTLSIYNNLKNSFPLQQSNTGTVFGRLVATQKIKDVNGNNIKIPLRNVPVGIFAPSDTFSDATSFDENGNRITLNLLEGSPRIFYFNDESFSADTQQFLQSGSQFVTVPNHYKHMTYTNQEGEFVLHNVPTGTQTLIFEVDMFKQGLTKDEIALNFFPFPADSQPNIDTVPSFFFRQFPIDVVPTWGDFQTGYTEVNIAANLDLRKWVTYYVPPVTIDGRTIEELQAIGVETPIQVSIRDMATEGFPIRTVEIVEIADILDREEGQQTMWRNEIKQLKRKAEFRRGGWHAFKLPANCYDPVGFKTDREGIPTANRGVWLGAYQLKLFYDSPLTHFRATGQRSVFAEGTFTRRDHYHLNYPLENYQNANAQTEGASVGVFPYERPWSHVYPEPYKIPSLPAVENPNYYDGSTSNGYVMEHPRYTDGDRIGHTFVGEFRDEGFGGGTGGYAVAYDSDAQQWYYTDFGRAVTRNILYRYENRGNRSEEYANGYKPNLENFVAQPGVSSVLNGEKYQRVECGYGYFLRPEGWARVANYTWWGNAEATFGTDTFNPNELVTVEQGSQGGTITLAPKLNSMDVRATNTGQKISLNLGSNSNALIKDGFLDLYRVVNSNPNNLTPALLGERKSYITYDFREMRIQNAYTSGNNRPQFKDGNNQDEWHYADHGLLNPGTIQGAVLYVENLGVKTSQITAGNGITYNIAPGQGLELTLSELGYNSWNYIKVTCEGNANFNYEERFYTKANYKFEFRNVRFYRSLTAAGSQDLKKTNFYTILTRSLDATPEGTTVYLYSISTNVKTRSNIFGGQKCDGDHYQHIASIRYRGCWWDGAKNKRHKFSYWSDSPNYTKTCEEDSGYLIIGSSDIQATFNAAATLDIGGTIDGLTNILRNIF